MSKFNVGDRIKRVAPNHKDVEEGGIYTVVSANITYYAVEIEGLVELEGLEGYYYEEDFFELAPTFTINRGDYIDSREFTRGECERFCELAVECGFDCGEWMEEHGFPCVHYLQIFKNKLYWCGGVDYDEPNATNITTQFREFLNLDKEKGKMFTKDDLKDGMRCTDRDGDDWYVCGGSLANLDGTVLKLDEWNDDLTDKDVFLDIIRVTDRDGTVVFEREEEPKELTLLEIAEKFGMPVDKIRIKK